MGFRVVVVKNRAKLEHRLNSLVVRGETEKKIFINEINTLVVQSTAVSLTASLLNELTKNNIKVIFCDEKCNPSSELVPYYGAHNTSKKYKEQVGWTNNAKKEVWTAIVKRKIFEQANHLKDLGYEEQSNMLNEYCGQVTLNDESNREGHAAKVYFNCILGSENSRQKGGFVNGCLNYGYAILLSAFNREIVASGFMTQLGIWHDNEFNQFNLSCDLMEPLRVVVDRLALCIEYGDVDFKKKLTNVLNFTAYIDGKKTTLDLAIRQYVHSVFNALNKGDAKLITFPEKVEVDEL